VTGSWDFVLYRLFCSVVLVSLNSSFKGIFVMLRILFLFNVHRMISTAARAPDLCCDGEMVYSSPFRDPFSLCMPNY
jgi:hypothetical protein